MGGEQFSEVGGGHTVQTVMGVKEDFVFYAAVYRKPVQCAEDGGDVLTFTHPHQDPGSAVLNILELLHAPARDPDEECVAVVQPGGDKGVDEFLSSWEGKGRAQFGNITEVKEGSFANGIDMFVKRKVGVKLDPKIGN